jgi:hypothetical protein
MTDEEPYRQIAEYHAVFYPQIWKALRLVDQARNKLIEAQNNLVSTVCRMEGNEFARWKFIAWYTSGGVTAADWKSNGQDDARKPYAHKVTGNGQLRVVPNRSRFVA